MDTIGCVHCHQHSTDSGCSPEGQEPGRNIGGPHSHVIPRLHAHGNKGGGNSIHVTSELPVGAGIVQSSIFEGILVRID